MVTAHTLGQGSTNMLGKMDHLCLATPRHSLRDNLSIVNIPLIATLGKWEKWIIYFVLGPEMKELKNTCLPS